ncbi:LacI family transcriptional regulator [Sorangium cellulosum]|uniref:LacI family transcriptional regulator n=1 Tax=Sorangium cellulosum TaxID=56 RepID=A0A2L0F889_SORCE|nr:substrate-binding domain-containing protein [Sorangium cellulosum]AUX47732.1 LacI family transcriptional regulator [Sorangium cellulosum]
MGQGGQDSGVTVPEQWGEVPEAPGQRPSVVPRSRSSTPAAAGVQAQGAPRPFTVGVITPFLDGSFWNPVLKGIHQSAQERGYRTLVLRGTPAELRAPSLAREHVDGWIVLIEVQGIEALARARVPLVTVGTCVPEASCPSVIPDNRGGMRSAVLHLVEHGHRRIAFVGHFDAYDVRQRFEAYKDALAEADIPFDPDLVIQSDNNWYTGGQSAAPALLARRHTCTAAVFGTDKNAIGMLPSLKAAGVRIPQDLAIVGFDDIVEAQGSDPPLTTVRQRFEMMGSAACDVIAAKLAGEAVPPESVHTANLLIQRSSCGCSVVQSFLQREEAAREGDAESALARQMVELLLLPRALPAGTPPAEVWPGVALVIDGYLAALRGTTPPPAVELERAYRQAAGITPDLGTLLAIVRLMDQSPERRRVPPGSAAEGRIGEFLELSRIAIGRARLDAETHHVHQLGVLARTNYDVSLALLGGNQEEARSLGWLATTTTVWSCLGLWEDLETRASLVIAGAYSRDGSPTPSIGSRCPQEAFPPPELLPPAAADGELMVFLLPIRSALRDWGVLALIGPTLVAMAGDEATFAIWGTLLGAALERDAMVQSLSEQHAGLERAYQVERRLSETVRELGCPVIPLLPGVLLVPLIGWIDGRRAAQVLERVTAGVNRHGAGVVLLDVTGVPSVDAQVADSLGQTSRAAALLGARVCLVGVRPEIARSLVGVDLGDLSTYASLSAAIQELAPAGARARRGGR